MDSCIQKDEDKLFCPVRQEWVVALPEERMRQRLLSHLTDKLRFPQSTLAVEKALNQMPHLSLHESALPDRRADIVCFAPGIHPEHALYPLLLIECKAIPLNDKVIQQVMGYNHYLKALFIAVANEHEIRMGWYDSEKGEYQFIPYIPTYDQLIRSIH